MGSSLSESLSRLLSSDEFSNPYDIDETTPSINQKEFIEEQKEKKNSKKESKKDPLESLKERTQNLTSEFKDDLLSAEFDTYVADFLMNDEDADFRNSLIRYGRKYARDTKTTGESSEIQKAYAESEECLGELLKEVNDDKKSLERDITQMRASRSRNYNAFSKMVEQRTTLHNTSLGIIKELNLMKKNQFELKMKMDKIKQEDGGDETAGTRAIQSLFGLGRDALIGSYEDVSGSLEAGELTESSYEMDEVIKGKIEKEFVDEESYETDGEIFQKYENVGAHSILEYDENGPIQIVVEDRDGNVLPDYPTPDINDLEFSISESTNSATDNLAQQYTLRKI